MLNMQVPITFDTLLSLVAIALVVDAGCRAVPLVVPTQAMDGLSWLDPWPRQITGASHLWRSTAVGSGWGELPFGMQVCSPN